MLAEERFREIQKYVKKPWYCDSTRTPRSQTTSESTVRRDRRTSQAWNSYQGSRWSDNCWHFREDKR